MKKSILKKLMILPFCLVTALKAGSAGEYINFVKDTDPAGWSMCYVSDNIYIFERWVNITDKHSVRERKGEMMMKCSFDDAVKMISGCDKQKLWMKNIDQNKYIRKVSSDSWLTYTLFDLPWPFENKDIISEFHLRVITPSVHAQILINSSENIIAIKDGISRIENYKAVWTIKKMNIKVVWISFSAVCDMPPVVPRFIQDPIVDRTFYQNLANLRSVVEELKSEAIKN
jgi:hypothetical protein